MATCVRANSKRLPCSRLTRALRDGWQSCDRTMADRRYLTSLGGRRICDKRAPDQLMILEADMTDKTVKVKVIDRWRVVHDGKVGVKGDTLTVPEATAQEWERSSGYVERVTGKS